MGKTRQKIDALFDYRGDISRNSDGASPRSYSSDYSPNNIRRVVIAPNGVLIVYHRSCTGTGGRSYGYVQFMEKDLYLEEQEKNYKPILRLLAHPLVCSCVEEILVLSNALSGQAHQNFMNEIKLETLVTSFKGAGSDLRTRMVNRFGRLRYYTVVSVNFKEFMNFFSAAVQSKEIGKYSFFSEMPALKARAQVTELAGPDYWKSYGVLPSTYPFDAKLKEYFDGIKEKREAAIKSQAVDAAREKRVGGKIQSINGLIEEYLLYNRIWVQYYNIVRKEGTNGVLENLGFVKAPEMCQIIPFKGMRKVPDQHISKQQCSENEAFERNEAALKNYRQKCVSSLAHDFLFALNSVNSLGEQMLLKVMVDGCETSVSYPPAYKSLAESIAQATGVEFAGRDLNVSLVNCCSQFMRFFVDCQHTEPFMREYWEGKLRKEAKS